MDEEDINDLVMERIEREKNTQQKDISKRAVIVQFACQGQRDAVIRRLGRVPFNSPLGRVFAIYPPKWHGLRRHCETVARVLRDHSLPGENEKAWHAQIRYSDTSSGIDVYIRRNKGGHRWMSLWEASMKHEYTGLFLRGILLVQFYFYCLSITHTFPACRVIGKPQTSWL